jgi:hypothetical protein
MPLPAAPVQPVAWRYTDARGHYRYRAPAAQPAIPDAITDNSESPEYRAGWNDCREVMAGMMK